MTFGLPRIVLGGMIAICAVHSILARAQAGPCIDTNNSTHFFRRMMTVKTEAGAEIPSNGPITSFNSQTGEVGLKFGGQAAETRVRLTAIKFDAAEPSMMAQVSSPEKKELSVRHQEFALSSVTVEQGVIRYPSCLMAAPGHEIAFKGTLSFTPDKLRVDGQFFDYAFRPGGGAPDTSPGRKPGA